MKTDLSYLERRREPSYRTPTPIPKERLSGEALAQLRALKTAPGRSKLHSKLGVGQATLEAALAGEQIASTSAAAIREGMARLATTSEPSKEAP